MVPQEVQNVKKWTEHGSKNTKSNFFQYMKARKHLNLAKWFITSRYGWKTTENLYFRWNYGFMVPQEVKKLKKWTEHGSKNTKSNFFQYMKALKHKNLDKWFITFRYGWGTLDNLNFHRSWGIIVPGDVQEVQKWTGNGVKSTKPHFLQYMKALQHLEPC